MSAWEFLRPNFNLAWNLFLALIPLILSFLLSRLIRKNTVLWWLGMVLFLAFLPNAPYVLTDVIHLLDKLQISAIPFYLMAILILAFLTYFYLGFMFYVFSLLNCNYFFQKNHWHRWIIPSEISLNFLSAIGIYLGRFDRLNSWQIFTHPRLVGIHLVQNLTELYKVATILVIFVVITWLFYLTKLLLQPTDWIGIFKLNNINGNK